MKKMNLILVGVLVSTLALAKGAVKPSPAGSSVAVTNSNGSTLFKVYYQSGKAQNVKVSVLDEKGSRIFSDVIKNTDSFIRPYNFKDLTEGQYTIQIEDENGKTLEKVNYTSGKIEKWIKVSRVAGELNKYVLSIASTKKDDVTINIFDKENNLVYNETEKVDGGFAKVFNLKNIDSFSIEVTDSKGLVKSVKY